MAKLEIEVLVSYTGWWYVFKVALFLPPSVFTKVFNLLLCNKAAVYITMGKSVSKVLFKDLINEPR